MSKLVIGCVGLLAVGVVGAAGASYFAYQKVTSTFAGFAELGSVPEFERSIRKQGPYAAPASGEPSRAQVERLLEVQQAVRTSLGTRFDEVYHRYRSAVLRAGGRRGRVGWRDCR